MGHEGAERYGGATDAGDRPGSPRSRLAGAGKQLAIVLQDVDLEAEPGLGAALIDAISAVDRAHRFAGTPERRPASAGSATGGRPTSVENEIDAEWVLEERDRPLRHLVREAHAE